VNQPTTKPTRKVAVGGVTGAVTGIIVWAVGLAGIEIPAEVAVYISTILSFAASYFVPDAEPPSLT
jgi:putative flippase GtrA